MCMSQSGVTLETLGRATSHFVNKETELREEKGGVLGHQGQSWKPGSCLVAQLCVRVGVRFALCSCVAVSVQQC